MASGISETRARRLASTSTSGRRVSHIVCRARNSRRSRDGLSRLSSASSEYGASIEWLPSVSQGMAPTIGPTSAECFRQTPSKRSSRWTGPPEPGWGRPPRYLRAFSAGRGTNSCANSGGNLARVRFPPPRLSPFAGRTRRASSEQAANSAKPGRMAGLRCLCTIPLPQAHDEIALTLSRLLPLRPH